MTKHKAIEKLIQAVWEMNKQAPYDFCGEQRDFYLPRMGNALAAVGILFPGQLCDLVAAELDDDEAKAAAESAKKSRPSDVDQTPPDPDQ